MRALNIHGLNVTMPHKNDSLEFLDEVDPAGKVLDSVNTVLNKEGKL